MWRNNRTTGAIRRSLVVALAVAAIVIPMSSSGVANVVGAAVADTAGPASTTGLARPERLQLPRLVSTITEPLLAGVVGINRLNDTFPDTDISVAAIAEIGDIIYVGGKFTQVEIAATGQRINQRFLAAFARDTGAWIPTFRPVIDGNVWDLKATDDGKLIVAGQFTSVNSAANTSGIAMLDPATGIVDPTWRVNLARSGSTRWPMARAIDIDGDLLYIGGNFTRITGTDGRLAQVVQIARVELSTGNVDPSFVPEFDGIIFDVDADGDRVYVVGNFLFVNGVFSIGLGVLKSSNGSMVPGLEPWVRTSVGNTLHSYQQAVLVLDNQVWQAGSQHSRQVYRRSDHALSRSWVSAPSGDGQALAAGDDVVYTGSHAHGESRIFQDAVRSPGLNGATSSRAVRWMAAFSTISQQHLAWVPQISSENGEGSWELFVDSTDCLWTGGDFNRGSFVNGGSRYVQGFAKFCP